MLNKAVISTDNAPEAIGTYSQAVKVGNTVYLSGQIPLDPTTMTLVDGGFRAQATQALQNLAAVCEAANGGLSQLVKLNVYMTDLENFAEFNQVMEELFEAPYPARAAIGVSQLPKASLVEVDGVLIV